MDRAAELYAAGWTLRRIGAELGVDHSTVAYRLHRAGAKLRRGGPRRHDVDTQQILGLRDQGMSMAAIAARVGMRVPGVWARCLRRAAGQDEIPITTETGLRSSVEDRWREAARAAGRGASIEEMRAVDADLVEHETQLLGWALAGGRRPARGWSGTGCRPQPDKRGGRT